MQRLRIFLDEHESSTHIFTAYVFFLNVAFVYFYHIVIEAVHFFNRIK